MKLKNIEEIKAAIAVAENAGENLYVLLPDETDDHYRKLVLDARLYGKVVHIQNPTFGWMPITITKCDFFSE